jgi:hypothetical protein
MAGSELQTISSWLLVCLLAFVLSGMSQLWFFLVLIHTSYNK